jgi:ABC-type branched-subunit amino acid transport system ATPase component
MTEHILAISNLNLNFTTGRQKEDALSLFRNLSMNIECEKITALFGGNGAGKTTLFNVISGLQKGATGNIIFEGKNILGLPPHQIANMGIGRLFQGARAFDELSIMDNMMIGITQPAYEMLYFNLLKPGKNKALLNKATEKAESILENLFGTTNTFLEKRHEAAGTLSFGQQRLLALARLLMGDYSLYLLDEPTAGVNVKFLEPIATTIRQMNNTNHKTVLMIEHNMHFVRELAEDCFFMSRDMELKQGPPQHLLDNEEVQKVYMGF